MMTGLLTFPRHKSNSTEAESDVMRPGGECASAPSPLHHKHSGVITVRTVRPELRNACAASPCVRGQGDLPRAHDKKKLLFLLGHVRWTDFCAQPGLDLEDFLYGEDHSLHGRHVHCCRSDRGLAVDVGSDHCGGRVL